MIHKHSAHSTHENLSRYTKTPKRDIFGHVKSISPVVYLVVYYTIALQHVYTILLQYHGLVFMWYFLKEKHWELNMGI
jgi:hypothetical protein